ncbi:MAG TPA: tetratricopeptide repeat protein [Anaeromyxobacteraceae bacterium]|nr:tetratricopeptide repeat protein [Anaeromyxobacteraceae bacterium]
MASIVEKYELILKADPKSRIFVELARALLEKGDIPRVIEICERGLEHHPNSILGRVLWGRALLERSELKAAMDQFEIGIALEPANPYAYNLVGEALLTKGHPREAIPVLARAVELQPADHRVQGLLDEAMRLHRQAPQPEPAAAPPAAETQPPPDEGAPEKTEPYRPIATPPTEGAPAAPAPAPEDRAASAETENQVETTGAEGRPLAPVAPATTPVPPPLRKQAGPATTPVPPPFRRPPPPPRPPSALDFIPGGREEPQKVQPQRKPGPKTMMTSKAEALKAAEQYEQELRAKAMKEVEAEKPSWWHRNRFTALFVALGLSAAAAGGVYFLVRERQASADALVAADRARAGLARDTHAALSQALEVLRSALKRRAQDPDVASLAAQVAAVLAVDHDDEKAKGLLPTLAADERAGAGALAARWALAEGDAARKAAEDAILASEPSGPPLLQALAGEILVARGELDAGRGRLEIAARATPPLLRAVVDLGDLALTKGDAEAALASYGQALSAHPTHPLAVAGAAEARLQLGRDLDTSAKEIAAVDADPGSAAPTRERLRYEVAAARVLAANGDAAGAAERLKKAAQELGKSVRLSSALAEVHLASFAWDKAESEAKRVVELSPKEPEGRVLLARARIGKGDLDGALAATEKADSRPAHLQRAIARYLRGEHPKAREELVLTQRDGKMTAEAATWYALTDLALKRTDKAAALLEKLTAAPSAPAIAFVALGRVRAAEGKPDEAERAWRAAAARDARCPDALSALGRHLLATGKTADAVETLARAVALDGLRYDDRVALAEAHVAAGDAKAAREDLDPVIAARPRDPDALRALASAWLADKSFAEAKRAADRAAAAAPRDARPLVIAARASLQIGERADALRYAGRAAKLDPKGPAGDEARKIAAEAAGRKR